MMHVALLGVCAWYFRNPLATTFVAAGEGEGSGAGVIEVGTIDASALGFTPPRQVSFVGEEDNPANNQLIDTAPPPPDPNAELLPSTDSKTNPKDRTTDRPTANQTSQLVSPTPLRGRSPDTSVDVGRTFGSQFPSMTAGVGVSAGADLGPNGVPGGSAYGRLIQNILSRNYSPRAANDVSGVQYVIIQIRIARDGRILSVENGRVAPSCFKRRSANSLINYDAERAIILSNPLPPFPNGFLMGAQEGVAEVLFRYQK